MSIQETLETLGLASEQTTTHFHKGTRDNPNIDVYRDKNSGVIYINDFYVGEEEYESGEYRNDSAALADKKSQYKDYERRMTAHAERKVCASFTQARKSPISVAVMETSFVPQRISRQMVLGLSYKKTA